MTAGVTALLGLSSSPAATAQLRDRYEFTAIHMAMPVRIVVYAGSHGGARSGAAAAFHRIAELENIFSGFRDQSELSHLQRRPGEWVPVSGDLFNVLAKADLVVELTEGAFDPAAGSVLSLWRAARRGGHPPSAAAVDSAMATSGWANVQLDAGSWCVRLGTAGLQIDLGGIAKGYMLEEALNTLREYNLPHALIEAGGDIVVGDAPPGKEGWRIALPGAGSALAARAERLTDAAVSTSGGSAQFLEVDGVRLSHIIDPRTGTPVSHRSVARVIAADATIADALATALNVLTPEESRRVLSRFPDLLAEVHTDPDL